MPIDGTETFTIQPVLESELKKLDVYDANTVLLFQVVVKIPEIVDAINQFLINAVLTQADQSQLLRLAANDPDTEMSETTFNNVKFFRELVAVFNENNLTSQLVPVLKLVGAITTINQKPENEGTIRILSVGKKPEAQIRETGTFAAVS